MTPQIFKAILDDAARAPAMAGIYIKSVSVSALYHLLDQFWVTISWTMPDVRSAIEPPGLSLPGVKTSAVLRPSDTAMVLHAPELSPGELEAEVLLPLAWRLGAWDIVRSERAPLAADQDWRDSKHGLLCHFGRNSQAIDGVPLIAGARASDEICATAAKEGWVTWRFVPLALSSPAMQEKWRGADGTLEDADCIRRTKTPAYRLPRFSRPTEKNTAADCIFEMGCKPKGKTSREVKGGQTHNGHSIWREHNSRVDS